MKKDYLLIWIVSAVLLIVIPSQFLTLTRGLKFVDSATVTMFLILLFALILLFLLCASCFKHPVPKWTAVLMTTTYYSIVYFNIGYWMYAKHQFNISLFGDLSLRDMIITALGIVNIRMIVHLIGLAVICSVLVFIFRQFVHGFEKYNNRRLLMSKYFLAVLLIGATIIVIPSESITGNLVLELKETSETYFPDNSIYSTSSSENIFIVQLESGNAFALNGELSVNGKHYKGMFYPEMYEIAKNDGILFPYFYANSPQTNRAQANILCGIANNFGPSLSHNLDKINTVCLPEILDKSGYSTLFFRSSSLKFANTGNFAKRLGFEEIHYTDIMQPDDLKYEWGYDDCIFYKRVFEYLKKNYPKPEKLLVYIEVSSHHPSYPRKPEYDFVYQFEPETNNIDHYLNSYLVQDYCVGRFYEEFKKFSPENSHTFVFPDHGAPLGQHGAAYMSTYGVFNENFLTVMAYVPPKNRKSEFQIGTNVTEFYSETDLMPTIFDLLNGESYANSFAFALKGSTKVNYDDCHILTQHFGGGKIAIVKGDQKYVYSLDTQRLEHYNLEKDRYEQTPNLISQNATYEEFKQNYFCERFKN